MSRPHKGRTEQAKADQAAPDLSNQSTVPPSPIQMKRKIRSKAVFPLYGGLGKVVVGGNGGRGLFVSL